MSSLIALLLIGWAVYGMTQEPAAGETAGSPATAGGTSPGAAAGSPTEAQAGAGFAPTWPHIVGKPELSDRGPQSERSTTIVDTRLRIYERPEIQAPPGVIDVRD